MHHCLSLLSLSIRLWSLCSTSPSKFYHWDPAAGVALVSLPPAPHTPRPPQPRRKHVFSRTIAHFINIFGLPAASHADWNDNKSTEGSVWYLAGSPVVWSTKKKKKKRTDYHCQFDNCCRMVRIRSTLQRRCVVKQDCKLLPTAWISPDR